MGTAQGTTFPPPSSGPAERRQRSAGSTLRARYSDPAQLSSLREPGASPTGPQVPQAAHMGGGGESWEGAGPTESIPGRWLLPWGGRGGNGGVTAASRPGPGQWGALMRALETSRTQSPTCNLGPQLTQGWMNWRALGRRPGSTSYLTLLCLASIDHWLIGTSSSG